MEKLFTVNFRYKERRVAAFVKLRPHGYDLSCLVRYLDKDIAGRLPGGKLVFSLGNGIEDTGLHDLEAGEELLESTTAAISDFLDRE